MKKKRLFSLVIAIALIISTVFTANLSVVQGADSGSCGTDATWSYDSSTCTLTISGTGATSDYGILSTNRVPWYSYNEEITTLIVEEGITEIGNRNFNGLTALTSVSLPSTLTTISGGSSNYAAFGGCTALESITLPSNLTTIETMAFRGCTALTSIKIPDSVTSLGTGVFRECTALTTVTFGTGLTSTGTETFYDCSYLKTVNFSSTITTIDSWSFYNTRITSIEIPETVTTISTRAFANCVFISSVTVYNANCTFSGDPFNGSNQELTFYGHSGSTTETYANDYGYEFVSIDDCDHSSTHEVITQAATCTEAGVTTQVCDECGFVVSETEIAALGHLWTLVETEDATETDGHIYSYYVCTNDGCGEEKTSIEHVSFVEGYYELDDSRTATCTTPGIEIKTCTVDGCGKTETTIIASGNHQVDEYTVTQEPTCTETGTQEGVCTVCGETVTETIAALGHTNVYVDSLDNTEEDGHTYEIYECSVCGEQTVVPTHVDWVDGCYTSTVISEAHCVISGLRRDVCDICSESRYVTLEANGQHEWYETTRTEPTCTSTGTIYYACSNCDLTKSESIDALGHDYVLQEGSCVEATCTTAGYNTYKCSRDGCGAAKTEVISATGHTSDESQEVVVTEPDCENEGVAECVCTVCGESYEETLAALGHDMQDVVTEVEDKPGHTLVTPTCTRCGQTDTATLTHDEWLEGYYTTTVITSGSCTVAQITRDTCSLCGETRTNTVAATGHSYSYTRTENDGTLVYTCSNCSNEETRTPSVVAALFIQYVNTKPTDTSLGYLFELNTDGVINAKDYVLI